MKARSFFGSLTLLLLLNALVKPLWIFGIDRRVQNAVGNEAYGEYFALFNLSYVLLFAADAGLTNLLTQKLAATPLYNAGPVFRTKAWLVFLYLGLCSLAGALAGIRDWSLFIPLMLMQALGSLYLFLRGWLAAQQLFTTDAVFSVLDKTLLILLALGPVYGWYADISLLLFVQLQLTATGLATVILFLVCRRRGLIGFPTPQRQAPLLAKQLLPFAAVVLLMAMHYRLDGFLLERLHAEGTKQAGLYAAAYRLLDAANMPGYLCASFLVPFLARHQNGAAIRYKVVLWMRQGLVFAGTAAAAFVGVFALPIQDLLYHSQDAYLNQVLRLSLAVLPAYYLVHVYGSVLTAAGKLKPFLLVLVCCAGLNAVINLLLIPRYGALGCCLAALASQYACGFLLWSVAVKRKLVPAAVKPAALAALCAAACYGLFLLGQKTGTTLWVILALASAAAMLGLIQQARIKQLVSAIKS